MSSSVKVRKALNGVNPSCGFFHLPLRPEFSAVFSYFNSQGNKSQKHLKVVKINYRVYKYLHGIVSAVLAVYLFSVGSMPTP